MEVYQIPSLVDNYIYILRNSNGEVLAIDPSTDSDVQAFLDQKGWSLNYILNTHHHHDHVGGNIKLKTKYKCKILGFAKDHTRIPGIDITLEEGQQWEWGSSLCEVLFIPGHTLGHIAFYFPKEAWLFCGDTLFSMGCGRLFEGSAEQMFFSLKKLSQLPEDTLVYCGHEYSEKNGQFALSIEGDNPDLIQRVEQVQKLRASDKPTVPSTLEQELKTNPFLRTELWINGKTKTITSKYIQEYLKANKSKNPWHALAKVREMRDEF